MPLSRRIPIELQDRVRVRANYLCEYCHVDERWQYVRFTIDHVIPIRYGGVDDFDNLALACFHYNRRKSDRTVAIDSDSGQSIRLFNPRSDDWADHFIWSFDGTLIQALTDSGEVTAKLMEFNRDRILLIRAADVEARRHPPIADPVQK